MGHSYQAIHYETRQARGPYDIEPFAYACRMDGPGWEYPRSGAPPEILVTVEFLRGFEDQDPALMDLLHWMESIPTDRIFLRSDLIRRHIPQGFPGWSITHVK